MEKVYPRAGMALSLRGGYQYAGFRRLVVKPAYGRWGAFCVHNKGFSLYGITWFEFRLIKDHEGMKTSS